MGQKKLLALQINLDCENIRKISKGRDFILSKIIVIFEENFAG